MNKRSVPALDKYGDRSLFATNVYKLRFYGISLDVK